MQKYDSQQIWLMIDSVFKITSNILSLLEHSDTKVLDNIDDNYNRRKNLLNDLHSFALTDDGKEFLKSNSSEWESRWDEIKIEDQKCLEYLQKNVNQLGVKIKDLNKKKALMVYLKR